MTETNFEDAESFSHNYMGDKITFRDIVLNHLRRISQFASVEFRGGYWQEKSVPAGNGMFSTVTTYIPDTREVYSNSIQCMADMLFPYFDEEMKKAEEECIKEREKYYLDNTYMVEPDREDKRKGDEEPYRDWVKGGKRSYRADCRISYQKLFRHLCSFLFRKKYLDIGTIED